MADIKINKKLAKSISYGAVRNRKNVYYIVIHYTGNKKDTAKNNAVYFATSNTRPAGAHFFVDKQGEIWKSV
ncbi:MAG: N-acetylmuramoyl-L-alanine amidase, partial [Roseburia sp.]|nr:N-acetylmuramoyl-L-alanine amidase [Roseburia sp.]